MTSVVSINPYQLQYNVEFGASGVKEVIQNVKTILLTRIGTEPLDRTFGTDWNFLDRPINTIQARLNTEFFLAVRKWEPRCLIKKITYDADPLNGAVYPTLHVEINLEA